MTADDFRRVALSLEGVEESSHMGAPDFRVGGRIFATLASAGDGYGNLMFDQMTQVEFISEWSDLFLPIAGGWGRMGMTHIRLAEADPGRNDGRPCRSLGASQSQKPAGQAAKNSQRHTLINLRLLRRFP